MVIMARQRGSHIRLHPDNISRQSVTVPDHKVLGRGLLRKIHTGDANLSVDEFFEFVLVGSSFMSCPSSPFILDKTCDSSYFYSEKTYDCKKTAPTTRPPAAPKPPSSRRAVVFTSPKSRCWIIGDGVMEIVRGKGEGVIMRKIMDWEVLKTSVTTTNLKIFIGPILMVKCTSNRCS